MHSTENLFLCFVSLLSSLPSDGTDRHLAATPAHSTIPLDAQSSAYSVDRNEKEVVLIV